VPDNIDLGEWSGSGATDRMHQTLDEYAKAANRQTHQLIGLTRQLVILTVVLVIGLVVQIVLAFTT
jgi:hypothetical protein